MVLKAAVPYQHAFWVHDQVTGIGHVPVLALIVPIRREDARIFCYETAAIKNVNFEVHAGSHIQGVCGRSAAHLVETSRRRSEEHTSELQSLMRISYAVFC